MQLTRTATPLLKASVGLAALATLALAAPHPASAQDLNGQSVTVDYVDRDQGGTFLLTLGTQTVTPAGATFNAFGTTNYAVTPGGLEITNPTGIDITFTPATFNGVHVYEAVPGGPTFTGVSILSNNLAGFDASRLSFDATGVSVNLQGLVTTPTTDLRLGFQFGNAAVPEPSQTAALGLGALGVLGLMVKARRRKTTA